MKELSDLLKEAEEHMRNTHEAFKDKLSKLNAGRPNPEVLNSVKVEAYGSISMLSHLANVSVQEPRTIIVNVWDKALVSSVDSAIRAAGLGFNPVVDGTMLKIYVPQPTEQRRKELIKLATTYAEETKVAHQKTHRREALDNLESLKKPLGLSEDDIYSTAQKVEKLTSEWVNEINELLKKKTKELETI